MDQKYGLLMVLQQCQVWFGAFGLSINLLFIVLENIVKKTTLRLYRLYCSAAGGDWVKVNG